MQQPYLLQDDAEEEEEELESTTESNEPYLCVSMGQNGQPQQKSVDDGIEEQEEESPINEDVLEEDTTPAFLSNLKLITLEDGRMFVTTGNSSE